MPLSRLCFPGKLAAAWPLIELCHHLTFYNSSLHQRLLGSCAAEIRISRAVGALLSTRIHEFTELIIRNFSVYVAD